MISAPPSVVSPWERATPEEKTGYALSIMSTAGATGSIIGPLIGGVVSYYSSNRSAFLFSAAIVLVSALIATFFAKEENFDRSAPRSRVRDDIREARNNRAFITLLLLAGISTFSVMILEPLLPIYLLDMGIAKNSASLSSGIVFSAVGIATVIMAPQWGRIGSRKGFGFILFIGLIGGGIGNILQYFVSGYVEFAILRFAYGLFYAGVLPSVNAMIVQTIEPGFRGRAFGLNQASTQLATMAGPIIGGLLGAFIPIRWVFVINGVMLLVAALLVKAAKLEAKVGSITSEEDIPPEDLRLPGTHEAPVDYVDGIVDEGSDPVLEGDPILAADIGLNSPETTLGPRADRNGRITATPAPERDELLESDAIFAAGAAGLTGSVIDYADEEDVPADDLNDDEEDLPLEDIPDADELQPGTAVDHVAPPLDVMPGTDVLNGSTGEED